MQSSLSNTSQIVECLKEGANGYLIKPTHIDIAIARIDLQLKSIKLIQENLRLKEVDTVNTMIVTYNHEILNPLAAAMLSLRKLRKLQGDENFEKTQKSLEKIAEIVRKIKSLPDSPTEKEAYSINSDLYKLK